MGGALAVLKRRTGLGALQVSLVGKAATLCLLYAFPLLFLGDHPGGEGRWPGYRLGFRDLRNDLVLVGRDALPHPGEKLRGRVGRH